VTHSVRVIDEVKFLVRDELLVPYTCLGDFPRCCGAGDGVGDLLVPDQVLGVPITPACYFHDDDWYYAEPTWEAYHASNSRFHLNIRAILDTKSGNKLIAMLRVMVATIYFQAVDKIPGALIFWSIKKRQIKAGMWPEFKGITP
jgi:hypothetical protein